MQRSVAMDLQSAWQTHAKAMTQVRPWDILCVVCVPGFSMPSGLLQIRGWLTTFVIPAVLSTMT